MGSDYEQREGGYWWPKYAKPSGLKYLKHADDMKHGMKHCKHRRVAVQAGGHVGMWPLWLSQYFTWVHTFEPEPRNFSALQRNLAMRGVLNVLPFHAALTDENHPVELRVSKNSGGHSVISEGGVDVVGGVVGMKIDGLELPHCDFIMLDVEGYEWPALKGAEQTLERCSPVIMLENRGHGVKKGRGDTFEELRAWLEARGYRLLDGMVRNDVIFIKG